MKADAETRCVELERALRKLYNSAHAYFPDESTQGYLLLEYELTNAFMLLRRIDKEAK